MAVQPPDNVEIDEAFVPAPAKKRANLWHRFRNSRFLLISVAVHVLFGLGAAAYVVQQISTRKLTFQAGPPSPNRSTRAIEHKVQMAKKQSTMTAPANKRIVSTGIAKVTLPDMPAMPKTATQPTKMAGAGGAGIAAPAAMDAATGGSAGGSLVSVFGFREAVGGSLVGTFYDLKQTSGRKPAEGADYETIIKEFVRGGWNEGVLQKFYRAPQALYATQLLTPLMPADEGPKAFNVERNVQPGRWVVLYRGRISPPESGTYHFVGAGDDIMVVRLKGGGLDPRVVLDRCYNLRQDFGKTVADYHYDFSNIPKGFAKGESVALNAGTFYDIEILIGEHPGGDFFAELLVEKIGTTYEKDGRGNPILPPFRVADTKPPALKSGQKLPPFAPNGPIWRAEKLKKQE